MFIALGACVRPLCVQGIKRNWESSPYLRCNISFKWRSSFAEMNKSVSSILMGTYLLEKHEYLDGRRLHEITNAKCDSKTCSDEIIPKFYQNYNVNSHLEPNQGYKQFFQRVEFTFSCHISFLGLPRPKLYCDRVSEGGVIT